MTDPRRILVRAPNWVGDMVMATPALRALNLRFPDARIEILGRAYVKPVIDGSPRVAAFHAIEPGDDGGLAGTRRTGRSLRGRHFDLAVLLANSLTAALQCFFARIPRRLGYAGQGRRLFLTTALRQPGGGRLREPVPMTRFYLDLLRRLGCAGEDESYEIFVTDAEREEAERVLRSLGVAGGERIVALCPGARYGASKLWPADRFAAAGSALAARLGRRVLVLAGPGEEGLVRDIVALMGKEAIDGSTSPAGLGALKAILGGIDLLVTTDSGPRHVAAALGRPVVVVMGPTHPGWTATNLARTRVVRVDVPCGPCHLRTCPTDHACMTRIEPSRVVAEALDLLAGTSV